MVSGFVVAECDNACVGLAMHRRKLSERIEFGRELVGGGMGLHPRLSGWRKDRDFRSTDGVGARQTTACSDNEIHCRRGDFHLLRVGASLLMLQQFHLLLGVDLRQNILASKVQYGPAG